MANICKNIITVIGLQDAPETFVKALSKEMFDIDLDNPKLEWWGESNDGEGPQSWYRKLAGEYRNEGCYAARLGILYIEKPYERCGVTVPSFYVETKWKPPFDELIKVSKAFPQLTFHIGWLLLQDGPSGEVVLTDGNIIDRSVSRASCYLFDVLRYPVFSLLPYHMPYTLAQHGTARLYDALDVVKGIRGILDDWRFTDSPYQSFRNGKNLREAREILDALLNHMEDAAKILDFEGVFLDDSQVSQEFEQGEAEMADFDSQQPLEEVLDAEAGDVEEVDF